MNRRKWTPRMSDRAASKEAKAKRLRRITRPKYPLTVRTVR